MVKKTYFLVPANASKRTSLFNELFKVVDRYKSSLNTNEICFVVGLVKSRLNEKKGRKN